ncbi:MAG: hypothetical protein C0483_25570 [Pirellula sp.]|nr:hypothetical protein [Pirellula sp.]
MDAATLDIEDRAACERYLIAAGHARAGDVVEHRLLAGGVSCRTVLVVFVDGRRWVLKQALAKLRVQADWFSDPNRIHREALGMRVLGELAPPGSIPKLHFDDETHHVIGMEAVPEPHENWKAMLLAGNIDLDAFRDFGYLLGAVHYAGNDRRAELSRLFTDQSYFESLRLEPYYGFSATQEPRSTSFYSALLSDTRAVRATLVHGDYSPKNILVANHRLVLLDHEVIHFGDPAFDVGFGLTHLLSKTHHLPGWRAHLTEGCRYFWYSYESLANDAGLNSPMFGERCVRHTLGCLLARVIGRSPLEYLSQEERERQREMVVRLMHDIPRSVPELIERFTTVIAAH